MKSVLAKGQIVIPKINQDLLNINIWEKMNSDKQNDKIIISKQEIAQHVFQKTLSIFENVKQRIHILPSWQDTDDYSDLLALHKRINQEETVAPHTARVLKSIFDGAGNKHGKEK